MAVVVMDGAVACCRIVTDAKAKAQRDVQTVLRCVLSTNCGFEHVETVHWEIATSADCRVAYDSGLLRLEICDEGVR